MRLLGLSKQIKPDFFLPSLGSIFVFQFRFISSARKDSIGMSFLKFAIVFH